MLDAVHATAKMETHVYVAVDDDDPELDRYQYVMNKAGADGDVLTAGPRKGLAGWTNEIAVGQAGAYPYLASLGDDHVPYTPGWDRALVNAIVRMGGTGFAYPWDATREDIPEAVVLSSDIVKALGWMCEPTLSHWYVDNVWADLGWGIGGLRHLRAIKVEHAWKADQTSKDSGEKMEADRRAYFSWRTERMAQDIAVLAGLKQVPVNPDVHVG